MINLFFRSLLVLALLFGLLFAAGMVVVVLLQLSMSTAVFMALTILLVQYLLGPIILEWIYKIEWLKAEDINPEMAAFIEKVCTEHKIPCPRFGLILDGNPNAFTFGHYPGNARLVVTSGLMERLDPSERDAVIAHELGHIAHWDFVVMTVAAVVPLIFYVIHVATREISFTDDDNIVIAAVMITIAVLSYIAYIVSHYIVLLLSRIREYFADQFSGEATHNPDALASALVKIAYGLASAPKGEAKKNDKRLAAGKAFGIFDPMAAQSLALMSAGTGKVSTTSMESAMKWDLWNPWAGFFELSSSHPLPAKRIRALELQSKAYNQVPRFSFRAEQPESYWDEFLVDLFIYYLPFLGLVAGLAIWFALDPLLRFRLDWRGVILISVCAAWWLKRRFSYRTDFAQEQTVKSLIEEIKVSCVRSIPCKIKGKIIGRGIPGLFYSEDLVLQDETGFIILDYRQPLRFQEFQFGWTKAESLIGQHAVATGWYRRSLRPYFEMRKLELANGETVTSNGYPFTQFLIYAGMLVGLILLI